MRVIRKHPRFVATWLGLILVVIVIGAVAGSPKKSKGSPGTVTHRHRPSTPPGPFVASDAQVTALVTRAINDPSSGSPGLGAPPKVQCTNESAGDSMSGHAGTNCFITYTIKLPTGISASLELIDPIRPIFAGLFKAPNLQAGYIQVKGPTTSIGGKSSTSDLFSLSCDRNANSQIDWQTVTLAGLKALCTYVQSVSSL